MSYTIQITPTAINDIAVGIEYYNAASPDLGYRFADGVAEFLERIAEWPTASAIRYKNIRCKPMKQFPYLITFIIDEATHSVNILRVFHTHQSPLY